MKKQKVNSVWLLKKLNRNLTEGLKKAIQVMEQWEELPIEKKRSTTEYAKKLISLSEEAIDSDLTET